MRKKYTTFCAADTVSNCATSSLENRTRMRLLNVLTGTYRHEVLDAYVFESLRQVRQITTHWMKEYNEERPHESLRQISPAMFRRQIENAENSSFKLSR